MINKNIAVARLWHRAGKNEYFGLKQLITAFPNIEFDFHIVLDKYDERDEWFEKIQSLKLNLKFYSKREMDEYASMYDYDSEKFNINNFIHFYHIIIGHYLRRVHLYTYMLTYEYDVIFTTSNLEDVSKCLLEQKSFGICEPNNNNCDKALYQKISVMFGTDILPFLKHNNPNLLGINAGFQGINLKLFDEFLSKSGFESMLNIFDFGGIYNADGSEKWGWERTVFDTQEQSFYGLLNQIYSKDFEILNTDEYFFHPCWDDHEGYVEQALKSKIVHFTGHVKSKKLFEFIENGLQYD